MYRAFRLRFRRNFGVSTKRSVGDRSSHVWTPPNLNVGSRYSQKSNSCRSEKYDNWLISFYFRNMTQSCWDSVEFTRVICEMSNKNWFFDIRVISSENSSHHYSLHSLSRLKGSKVVKIGQFETDCPTGLYRRIGSSWSSSDVLRSLISFKL